MEKYRTPYEAYPFLTESIDNFRCEFEILTDEIASTTSLLRAQIDDEGLQKQLLWLCEMIYHANPTLRSHFIVTPAEVEELSQMVSSLEKYCKKVKGFVLPQGCESACTAHVLRTKCKALVHLVYRHQFAIKDPATPLVATPLLDFCNLLSRYFFFLALRLNQLNDTLEVLYTSRDYNS